MSDADADVTRRACWTEQFEAAYRFMFEAVLPYPVAECGERQVSLREAADIAQVTLQFSERPHVNGLPRLFYLRDGQIPGFIGAAALMNGRGWVMRVEDGYRTPAMQKHLGRMPQVFDAVLVRCGAAQSPRHPRADAPPRPCRLFVGVLPLLQRRRLRAGAARDRPAGDLWCRAPGSSDESGRTHPAA